MRNIPITITVPSIFLGTLRGATHQAALLPPLELLVDAVRRLLPAHCAGGGLYFGKAFGEMADRLWLGLAGTRHIRVQPGPRSGRHPRGEYAVSE